MILYGIFQGLRETARNFLGSYVSKERLVTIEYPEQKAPIAEAYRSFPFLVHDGEDPVKGLRCTACKICEKECPPQCIFIVPLRDEKGKVAKHPKVFDIDFAVCMGCGICAEVCPFDSIKMDKVYEIAVSDRFKPLVMTKAELSKSNAYYNSIRPTEAAEVDAALAEAKAKAEAAAKAKEAAAKAKAAADAAAKAAAAAAPAPTTPPAAAPAPAPEAPKPAPKSDAPSAS